MRVCLVLAHHGMPIYLVAYVIGIARCGTVPLGAASRRCAVLGATFFPSNGLGYRRGGAPKRSKATPPWQLCWEDPSGWTPDQMQKVADYYRCLDPEEQRDEVPVEEIWTQSIFKQHRRRTHRTVRGFGSAAA